MPVLPVFDFSVQQQDVRCMPLYHVHHKYALCPHRSLRQLLCRSTPGAYLLVSCGSQWLMLSVTRLHLRCDPSRCLALMPSGVPCSLSPLPTRAGVFAQRATHRRCHVFIARGWQLLCPINTELRAWVLYVTTGSSAAHSSSKPKQYTDDDTVRYA
jgi:hypothetical protein